MLLYISSRIGPSPKPFTMTGQLNDWLQTEGLVDLSPRLENLGIHDIDEMAKISDVAATQLAGEVGMNQVRDSDQTKPPLTKKHTHTPTPTHTHTHTHTHTYTYTYLQT